MILELDRDDMPVADSSPTIDLADTVIGGQYDVVVAEQNSFGRSMPKATGKRQRDQCGRDNRSIQHMLLRLDTHPRKGVDNLA